MHVTIELHIPRKTQGAVGVWNVDLGEQRPRAGRQCMGEARHLAGERAVGNLGYADDCVARRRIRRLGL
jgi:hypothetical protein